MVEILTIGNTDFSQRSPEIMFDVLDKLLS